VAVGVALGKHPQEILRVPPRRAMAAEDTSRALCLGQSFQQFDSKNLQSLIDPFGFSRVQIATSPTAAAGIVESRSTSS
jgi:hypothetical protein